MYFLCVHEDAAFDLERLWSVEPDAAARILVLLEELEGNQDLLSSLTEHGFGEYTDEDYSVSKWLAFWNRGRDLWRLKIWDLEDKGLYYRIIYAYVPETQHYHVLAIAPRNFNYDTSHPISRRIYKAYEDL